MSFVLLIRKRHCERKLSSSGAQHKDSTRSLATISNLESNTLTTGFCYLTEQTIKNIFTSALRSSPPDKASSCAAVTSSDISIPDIFWTTSFNTSKSKLFPALSWLATYCRRPVSSMEYLRNTVPQNTARPETKQWRIQLYTSLACVETLSNPAAPTPGKLIRRPTSRKYFPAD